MKKIYLFLLAACGIFTTASAQTTADLAGKYSMTCSEVQMNPAIEGLSLATTYNVTITPAEKATDSVYVDGFLGMTVNSELDPEPLGAKYDAAAKTLTITQRADQAILDPATFAQITLKAPVVLKVATAADGTITLTPQQTDGLSFTVEVDGEDGPISSNCLIETYSLAKKQVFTISKADLVGTYDFTYVPLDMETMQPGEAAKTTFTISANADGELFFSGVLGSTHLFPIVYGENSFTIAPVADESDPKKPVQFMSLQMGSVEAEYGEGGSISFPGGFVIVDGATGVMAYVNSGTAVKQTVSSIGAAAVRDANATVKAYNLAGVLVGNGRRADVTAGLPSGLYIIGGQKVFVK